MKVDLWDLPEKNVYVKIKKDVRLIKKRFGGAKKLSKLLKKDLRKEYIYSWKHGIRFCPLWIIKGFLTLLEKEGKIKSLTLKQNLKVYFR